jgi:hypothetical protein
LIINKGNCVEISQSPSRIGPSNNFFHFYEFGYAWHADLGLSDQQATDLMKSNPNDPQIVQWKNSVQNHMDVSKACFDTSIGIPQTVCDSMINSDYVDCVTHPGALLACMDPRISRWVHDMQSRLPANLTNSTK